MLASGVAISPRISSCSPRSRWHRGIDARMAITHADAVFSQNQLREAFRALAAKLPEPYELSGVTFHGPGAYRDGRRSL